MLQSPWVGLGWGEYFCLPGLQRCVYTSMSSADKPCLARAVALDRIAQVSFTDMSSGSIHHLEGDLSLSTSPFYCLKCKFILGY
uniref:Uncharacterized protein n=1 Tax=Mus spicilegus TaxID=10103 RepID=A0A8C6GBN4_MUSSI